MTLGIGESLCKRGSHRWKYDTPRRKHGRQCRRKKCGYWEALEMVCHDGSLLWVNWDFVYPMRRKNWMPPEAILKHSFIADHLLRKIVNDRELIKLIVEKRILKEGGVSLLWDVFHAGGKIQVKYPEKLTVKRW